jgi:hypothetical protein
MHEGAEKYILSFCRKSEERRKRTKEDNIKMDLEETGWYIVDWNNLPRNRLRIDWGLF